MILPRPHLGADPLRPPTAGAAAGDGAGGDPILDAYGPQPEPTGEAAGIPVGPDEVTAGLVGIFALLAMARGPHWAVEPEECALVAPPLARELSKPDTTLAAWLAKHGDPLLIVVGMSAIVIPRAILEWRVLQLRREQLRAEPQPQYEAPSYGPSYEPVYQQPDTYDDAPAARADAAPPAGGPRSDLPAAGEPPSAGARPSDPASVAASLGAILG